MVRYRRIAGLIVIVGLIIGLAGSLTLWQRFRAIQPTLPGPNLLPNSDFALDADADDLPDGWTTAGVGGVRLGDFTVHPNSGRSVEISGINNYIASPFITVRPRHDLSGCFSGPSRRSRKAVGHACARAFSLARQRGRRNPQRGQDLAGCSFSYLGGD